MERLEDRAEIADALRGVVWDYTTDPMELYDCVRGAQEEAGPFSRSQAFVRLLTRLPWYTMLALFGVDRIRELLDDEALALIWPPGRREHYERLRKILRGETLPATGWDPESRKRLRPVLISDRWYRS
ncbi:MAG: hypothetical protein HS115_10450 [Spirochaetales bacterium]|nr:hypothetical protein [Spirochaetales bacterium]